MLKTFVVIIVFSGGGTSTFALEAHSADSCRKIVRLQLDDTHHAAKISCVRSRMY